MQNDFTHDVFLSHSAKDKAVVRPLAERLRADESEFHPSSFLIHTFQRDPLNNELRSMRFHCD